MKRMIVAAALIATIGSGLPAGAVGDSEQRHVTITVQAAPAPPPLPVGRVPPAPPPPTIRIYSVTGAIYDIPMSVVSGPALSGTPTDPMSGFARFKVGDVNSGAPPVPTSDVNYGHYGPLNAGVAPKK